MKDVNTIGRLLKSTQNGFNLLKEGHVDVFGQQLRKRLENTSYTIGLKRDLSRDYVPPKADIDISIRLIQKGDIDHLFEYGAVEAINPTLVKERRTLLKANIPCCYVAVTENDNPCFIQWLFNAEENQRIKNFFQYAFPPLAKDEALLESAYMHRAYRGLGIMPYAIDKIIRQHPTASINRVITFVDIDNIASLKGIKRSGFEPYIFRKDQWVAFRRRVTYHQIPQHILQRYKEVTK